MATDISRNLCNICNVRNKACQAIKWCPECEEKLCEDCLGNHAASKLSRNHEVIDIEHYRKLPESVLAVKNICDDHGMKLTSFCQKHDTVCCPVCISKSGPHSKCTTVALEEVIKTSKSSVLLQSVEDTLKNLKDNLRTIINDRQSNLKKLREQKAKIIKEVFQIKEKIIKHLNNFEKKLFYDLDKTIKKDTNILSSEIATLEQRFQQAETMSDGSNTMKQYGSDFQIFIGSRSINLETNTLNNNVRELVEKMKQFGVTLQWNSKVNEVTEKLASLGSILEEETPMAAVLTSDQGTQVHVMTSPPRLSIEGINIKLKSTYQINGNDVCVLGCSVFPDNITIFADNVNGNIILFNETAEKVIPTSSGPYDVTVIDDNNIAVSTEEGVEVINITTNTVDKTIRTGRCRGLEYYKGFLFRCVRDKGVLSLDLSSNTITTVIHDERAKGWYYCTVYNDRIFTTRSAYFTITCYTMEGDKIWEYKDQSVIDFPLGIAVDDSSNIYIASKRNHSIIVLSADGQRHRTLLTKKDGIQYPWALYLNRSRNQLLVGNRDGPGLLFSI